MGIFRFLGKVKGWPAKKEFLMFFIIILIPNLFRQVIYFVTFLKTNQVSFIDSFETVAIYSNNSFYLGVLEEIVIGTVYAILWFKFKRLKFLSYAWISDAMYDYLSVLVWVFVGMTPLQLLGLNSIIRFLLREVLFCYVIAGPLLYHYRANIKKLSLAYTLAAILFLIIILVISGNPH